MTPAALRKIALALPEATEEPHFDRASFRIRKKIFATMKPDGSEAMVRVSPPEKVEALLKTQPEVFFTYGTWTQKNGSLGVRLGKVKTPLMSELMREAYAGLAPKRLR